MKPTKAYTVCTVLAGALLTGMLWRARGTHGWGAAWGLLAVGFGLTLFLTAAVRHKKGPSLRLVSLTALSFMLTAPAWGTLLNQISGVFEGRIVGEGAADVYISPAVGVLLMALMGFGLAGMYGVLLGRCFSDREWRAKDYILVLAVFLVAAYGAKASVAHPLVKLIEPEAAAAFQTGLQSAGINKTVFGAYLAHFNAEGWAKKIDGGRHYYACVSAVASAVGSLAAILAVRFGARDRFAAKTGAVVCGAFAFSISLADLFFFFANGGYRFSQGFSLPETFAAWSLWEYFTGFIAGGVITAFLLRAAPRADTAETVLRRLQPKALGAFTFVLCMVGAVGVNIVRPVLLRTDETNGCIVAVCIAVAAAVAVGLLLSRKYGFALQKADAHRLPLLLCAGFAAFVYVCYMFIGRPEISGMNMLHNQLFTASFAGVEAYFIYAVRRIAV